MGEFFLGCAVWAYKGWVGEFYPSSSKPGDFLSLYCERMGAVEGNTTFYAVPDEKTLERWAEIMPTGFHFLPKLPRPITHQGEVSPYIGEAARFVRHMGRLGASRLGPFHMQLPPSYGPENLPDLATFLSQWPREEAELVVELRHPGFFYEPEATQIDRLLHRLGMGRVLLDTRPVYQSPDDPQLHAPLRKPSVPLRLEDPGPIVMMRFISHPDRPRNLPYLRRWAPRVARWLAQGKRVYFFGHCPQEEHSPSVAVAFYELLREQIELPPLGWALLPPPATQQNLGF